MKKTLLVVLTLMLALAFAVSAHAEDVQEIDTSFEGVVFTYNDINMQIKIPSEWYRIDLTEDDKANGFFDHFQSEEGLFVMLNLVDNNIQNIIDAVQTNEAIQDPQILTVNGIETLIYVDIDAECYGTVIPFQDGTKSVLALMGPIDDADIASDLLTIVATINTIQ